MIKTINSKFATRWALIGVLIGLFAFSINYHWYPATLIGYEVFAGPAMFALSFFSEETNFWPKLAIFCAGQFLFYFIIAAFVSALSSMLIRKAN